ncbi:Modification methylase LlaDCHIA [Candidatus Promineifilum breve]|uniref:Site-specific DNA-methyltransferase (adenine-specific) n=1 Tax=Candidatus Promineifilum breve TaxID=1806508 RepID=A0A160T1V5_9CHLR|nr:DNA adenine methylase [Candidatus Promineifilum breve]CUS03604.2 Modification methylase LlaDCHIA [Candidatus Promineifilum breve]
MTHTVSTSSPVRARPVLKWAGGKGQLLPDLLKRLPDSFEAYHEPFVGGGALFFELATQGQITTTFLSDINDSLIDVYLALRDCVEDVIVQLRQHKHDHDYYYQVRAVRPETLTLPERAARIIFLNKTCYNGLYRENRRGEFNVPFGRYKNPTICDEANLRAAARVLQGVDITRRPFATTLDYAKAGDFVYFDPPYHPLSATANFTAYDRAGFGPDDQRRLRDVFAALAERGVMAMLSNSDTPFIRELYAGFTIDQVFVARAVNSKANGRGKVAEVIVRNY